MQIAEKLFKLKDIKYKDFHAKLIPNVSPNKIIGVRTPSLRTLVKSIKNGNNKEFFDDLPHNYYEENNVHAFLISEIRDFDKCIKELEKFLPYIDNWATCDGLRPKCFKSNRNQLICCIKKWINSEHEYTVRFAVEMLMVHYLDEDFDEEYLEQASSIKSSYYYVNMMIAWYFATALAKKFDKTIIYIQQKKLSNFVHNKTIQKAIESFRITNAQKSELKKFIIKN